MKAHMIQGVVFAGALLLATGAEAQKGRGETEGLARQGAQPALLERSGVLAEIKTGPCEATTGRAYIGTHLFVQTDDGERLNIHVGAADAVREMVEALTIGERLDLTVFRTDLHADGHYVAKAIQTEDKTYAIRNDALRPFWAGRREAPGQGRRGPRRRGR